MPFIAADEKYPDGLPNCAGGVSLEQPDQDTGAESNHFVIRRVDGESSSLSASRDREALQLHARLRLSTFRIKL